MKNNNLKIINFEDFFKILNEIPLSYKYEWFIDINNYSQTFGTEKRLTGVKEHLLKSSIEGPKDYYYDLGVDRITEIYFRLTNNHCFANGNKRTASLFLLISFSRATILTVLGQLNKEYNEKFITTPNLTNETYKKIIDYETKYWNSLIEKWFNEIYDFSILIADSIRTKSPEISRNLIKHKIVNEMTNKYLSDNFLEIKKNIKKIINSQSNIKNPNW